jgi:hypothetical protein
MLTEQFKQKPCEDLSRKAARRGGTVRSSEEVPDKGMEPRDRVQRDWNIVPTRDGRSQCPSQNQPKSAKARTLPLPPLENKREVAEWVLAIFLPSPIELTIAGKMHQWIQRQADILESKAKIG